MHPARYQAGRLETVPLSIAHCGHRFVAPHAHRQPRRFRSPSACSGARSIAGLSLDAHVCPSITSSDLEHL